MILRGYPFLMSRPVVCEVFGISRWTLQDRMKSGAYPLIQWVKDGGSLKAVKPSVERQLESMVVKKAA